MSSSSDSKHTQTAPCTVTASNNNNNNNNNNRVFFLWEKEFTHELESAREIQNILWNIPNQNMSN